MHVCTVVMHNNYNSGFGSGSGDDEGDCPDGSYLCSKSIKCILESSLCDGIKNCNLHSF